MSNDLMLREEGCSDSSDQDLGNFYSSQPGDAISQTTAHRRNRRACFGFGFVFVGTLLILGGVVAACFGEGEQVAIENEMKDKTPLAPRTRAPSSVPTRKKAKKTPTAAPTAALVEPATVAPSQSNLFLLLSEYVGQEPLLDPESILNAAYTWLLDNSKDSQLLVFITQLTWRTAGKSMTGGCWTTKSAHGMALAVKMAT
jgi:hypothetical protein